MAKRTDAPRTSVKPKIRKTPPGTPVLEHPSDEPLGTMSEVADEALFLDKSGDLWTVEWYARLGRYFRIWYAHLPLTVDQAPARVRRDATHEDFEAERLLYEKAWEKTSAAVIAEAKELRMLMRPQVALLAHCEDRASNDWRPYASAPHGCCPPSPAVQDRVPKDQLHFKTNSVESNAIFNLNLAVDRIASAMRLAEGKENAYLGSSGIAIQALKSAIREMEPVYERHCDKSINLHEHVAKCLTEDVGGSLVAGISKEAYTALVRSFLGLT